MIVNDLLKLIFNATPIAFLASDAAVTPLTNLYVSLHTADPGISGTQSSFEAGYTGYTRVAVARTTIGWSVVNNTVKAVNTISFGECTALPGVPLTHWAIGTASTGIGKKLYSGILTPVTMRVGTIPVILGDGHSASGLVVRHPQRGN